MDVDKLIEDLALVDANILEEAARQPALYVNASRHRVECMRVRGKAKAQLEYLEARIASLIRGRARDSGRKISEATVRELVAQNRKLREAIAHYDRAIEDEEFSKLLLDAYKMRRDAIRITADHEMYEGMRGTHELDQIEERMKLRRKATKLAEARGRRKHEQGDD